MNKTRIYLVISSLVIWIPVLIVLLRMPLIGNTDVLSLMYLLLLVCPAVSAINILIVLVNLYKVKAFNFINIIMLILNILFLTIGMEYLKEIAWII